MNEEHAESLAEMIKDRFNEAVGLPPRRSPEGGTELAERNDIPHGTLTSEDAEGVPVPKGTGIAVE